MLEYRSIFYGDIRPKGYRISYLLISHKIEHEFVLLENEYVLSIETKKRIREFVGYDEIIQYIEAYKYIFEFPEITRWS